MIDRDHMARTEILLRDWKKGEFDGHPIHSQQIFITPDDVERLRDAKIHVWTFVQRPGQAVFIPAGVGHQVTNLSSCIKIAVDFVNPANVMHSNKIGQELRQHRLESHDSESEDVLQLASMAWWFYVRSKTDDFKRLRSDPYSDPWISPYSAAPRYLQVRVNLQAGAVHDAQKSPASEEREAVPEMRTRSSGAVHDAQKSPASEEREAVSEMPDPEAMDDLMPDATPMSLDSPPPLASSSVPSTESAPAAIPSKRSCDSMPAYHRHRRAKKARVAALSQNPERTLQCPIDAPGKCKRQASLFKRQELLDHLEQTHREYVAFRDPSKNMTKRQMGAKRLEILGFAGDDQAFLAYLKDLVLSKEPSVSP
ncbi:unnamed protein product [Peniophora sp. CBMAI 1063]|nr:unnamed protein product [Peniophora sp. CBMAI 1063]